MSYDLINLMIPSFKRVDKLQRCIQSALDTAQKICFTICVNVKDEETLRFIEAFPYARICPIFETTNQPNLSLYYNRMYEFTPWRQAIVSMIGDDMVFTTKDWDLALLEEFNIRNGELVLYCNDGDKAGEDMCVNLFTSRRVVDAQKKPFMCQRYRADMIDFIWFLTGTYTSLIKYRGDIVIDHRHSRERNEQDWDETFKRLAPFQDKAKREDELTYAIMYASVCAVNLLKAGIGINPVISANPLFLKNTDFVSHHNHQ